MSLGVCDKVSKHASFYPTNCRKFPHNLFLENVIA